MKVVGLVSGGKDSCYNMMQCVAHGHEIVALANLRPPDTQDEMDSYMYQTVGHHAIELYALAMDLPLYRRTIQGTARNTDSDYLPDKQDEVEDLVELLKQVQQHHDIEAVSVGAILSNYQRVRVENVCGRLGLTSLGFLWRREQEQLLKEMIDSKVEAIIIKVAALGLAHQDLGKSIEEIYPKMRKLAEDYGCNVCGEGGEYETFTLDCPLFNKRLVLDEKEVITHTDTPYAPVAYMNLRKIHLEQKDIALVPRPERLADLPMTLSRHCLVELDISEREEALVGPMEFISCREGLLESQQPCACRTEQDMWLADLTHVNDGIGLEQSTKIIMDNLGKELNAHGLKYGDIAVVHLYVRDMSNFLPINNVYKQYFGINPPVRICVEADLAPNQPLLLDCYVRRHGSPDDVIRTMHVQGISHWAPANIGPYSQCKRVGGSIYVAGQIALVPGTMVLVEGGITAQSRLSLRHVTRVLDAMANKQEAFDDVTGLVCYVTHPDYIPIARAELGRVLDNCWMTHCWISYVVIPRLPRNALIEWETIAHVNREQLDRKETFCTIHNYNVTAYTYSMDKVLVNGHIRISAQTSLTTTSAEDGFESNLAQILVTVLRNSGVKTARGLCRLFYRRDDFTSKTLSSGIIGDYLKNDDITLALTCIPVCALDSKDALVSMVLS